MTRATTSPAVPSRAACILHGIAPLGVGGLMYAVYRPPSLVLFDWLAAAHLDGAVMAVRDLSLPTLPDWVVGSVPNALWAYSLLWWLLSIWRGSVGERAVWACLASLMVLGPEVTQGLGWLSGTFDWIDVATSIAAIVLAVVATMRPPGRAVVTTLSLAEEKGVLG